MQIKQSHVAILFSNLVLATNISSASDSISAPASLPQTLHHLASKYGICNVAAVVIKHRQIEQTAAAQGCSADTPLTPEAVFQAASLGKPVFAYAVLKLVQAGQMELDAPITKYLPRGYDHRFRPWALNSKIDRVSVQALQGITVRMALNHTAGLPNWSDGPLSIDFTPGTQWQYSGEGYALLQSAVEAVTHETLDEFMARQVFKPLGMAHSAYTLTPPLEKQLVPGTTRDGVPLNGDPFPHAVAAFTLYTSAQDYGRFLAALLNDPPLLQQTTAFSTPVNDKLKIGWGLGWGLEHRDDDTFIWHWGNNPGYRNFVMASPRSGDGFVMLSASDQGLIMAEALANAAVGPAHPIFRFPLLRDGLAHWLCEAMDICP